MKKLLLILTVCFPTCLFSQKIDSTANSGDDKIFAEPVDVMPEFKGGMPGFYDRLKNIPYLFLDEMNGRQGEAIVLLVVEKDGSVSNVRVIHGISQQEDDVIKKRIMRLQKWKPGLHNGQPVRVQFEIPISFRLVSDL